GAELAATFHERYAQIYGYADPSAEAEIINIRSTIVGRVPKPRLAQIERVEESVALRGTRRVRYDGAELNVAVVNRTDLGAGARLRGPVIIEQYDTTTFVTPGWTVDVDVFGNLIAEACHDAC